MSVYEGEWVNGKREGDGRQVFADGDWYEGKWYADLPDGKGRFDVEAASTRISRACSTPGSRMDPESS